MQVLIVECCKEERAKEKNTQLPQIYTCNFCFIAFPHMKVTNLDSEAAVLVFFIEKGER